VLAAKTITGSSDKIMAKIKFFRVMPVLNKTRQTVFWQIISAKNALFMADLTKLGGFDLLFAVAA
jgi:hypothetical protein